MSFDPSCLPEFLQVYYRRLFPYKHYCRWLSYDRQSFVNREFAFILKDDVYLRYKSFSDQLQFEKEVQNTCPFKIDIGAVFNHPPKDHKLFRDFDAVERELVFDIDLTDYDDIRSCCSGGSMCKKCWKFIVIAVKILDKALEEDFGFAHRLWVYSGRRGIHCWVCDETARKLSPQGRATVVEYLTFILGGENQTKKVKFHPTTIHPAAKRAAGIIKGCFCELVEEQGWLDGPNQWKNLLLLVNDEDVRCAIEKDFCKHESVSARWKALLFRFDPPSTDHWKPPMAYPRLDVNVTKGLNHLLKSPFCVHPKTGKIAVPLEAKTIHLFDPDRVPRIDLLLQELSENKDGEVTGQPRKRLDYKRTSLADYVDLFERFVDNLGENYN